MLTHHHSRPVNPSRVVVLGSGGFIGQTLTKLLESKGIPSLGLSSGDIDLTRNEAGNLLAERIRPDDSLVILSAKTPDKGRGIGVFQSNVAMLASVAEAVANRPPAHIVYFSSDAVYQFIDSPVDERSAAEPTDLYGAMHLSRELMIKSTCKAPIAVLRPTLIYGFKDTHNSYGPNRFRRMAFNDKRITMFGNGEEERDHIFVDDVAELTLLVMQHKSAGLLNLATGHSISYRNLANKIASLFDYPIEIQPIPRANSITHRHFDVSALKQAFPRFHPTTLDEGLARIHREESAARANAG